MRKINGWVILGFYFFMLILVSSCAGGDKGDADSSAKRAAPAAGKGSGSSEGRKFDLFKAKAFDNGVGEQNFHGSIDMKSEIGQNAALVKRVKAELVAKRSAQASTANLVGGEGVSGQVDGEIGIWQNTDPINSLYFEKDGDKRKAVTKHLHSPMANYPAAALDPENRFDACGDWKDMKKTWYYDDSRVGNNYVFLMGTASSFNMGETDLSRKAFGNKPLGPYLEITKQANDEIVAYRSAMTNYYTLKAAYYVNKKSWDTCKANAVVEQSWPNAVAQDTCGAEPQFPVKPTRPEPKILPERGACAEKLFKYPYQFEALQSFDFPQKANYISGKGSLVIPGGPTFSTTGEGKDYAGLAIAVREPLTGEDNALAIQYFHDATNNLEIFNVIVELDGDGAIVSTWAQVAAKIVDDGNVAGRITSSGAPETAASLLNTAKLQGAWEATGDAFIDHARMNESDFSDIVQCVQNQAFIRGLAGGGYNQQSAEQRRLMAQPYAQTTWVDQLRMEIQEGVTSGSFPNGVPKVSFGSMLLMSIEPAPAIFDRYGREIVKQGCTVDGIRYQEGDACYLFCSHSNSFSGSCYRNIVPNGEADSAGKLDLQLNSRRRAIMDSTKDDSGLLYMSMKGPMDQIFTVRVHHNLHKSHMFGSSKEVGGEDLDDGIFREKRTFTFPIPFCPKLDEKYEYVVCNVPKSRAHDFGIDEDGAPLKYPSCFKDQAAAEDQPLVQSWAISNARVGDERIPKNSWQQEISRIKAAEEKKAGATVANQRAVTPWDQVYQLLKKTTFYVSSAALAQGLKGDAGSFIKGSKFTHACIPDKIVGKETIKAPKAYRCKNGKIEDENNVCSTKAFPRGSRMLRHGLIKFEYTTYDDITEPDDSMFLYLDTNPDPQHYFHKGFTRDGNMLADIAENKVIPAAISDEKFACYRKADGSLKEGIISKNYSPLVINVAHKPSVALTGLETGVEFVGRRFDAAKGNRKEEYSKQETTHFLPADAAPGSPTIARQVMTGALVKTGWIDGAKGDALLVLDLNENGKIDSGMELFGEATVMEKEKDWGKFGTTRAEDYAPNGFVALLQYDENDDFVIDAQDSIWSKLRFWQDGKDGQPNGEVDDGELLTLDSLKIVSFDLGKIVEMTAMDKFGNRTLLRSAYSYKGKDGKVKQNMIFDVYFIFAEAGTAQNISSADLTDAEKTDLETAQALAKKAADQKARLLEARATDWK